MAGHAHTGHRPSIWAVLMRSRLAVAGLAVLGVFVLLSLLAPLIAPWSPSLLHVAIRLQPPSFAHPFGTDDFGRDVLARTLYAGRLSLLVAVGVVTLSTVIGVTLGLLAGFFPRLDTPVARLIDAMMAFPDILLAIALVAALGQSLSTIVIALGITYAPRLARIVRGSTLVIRELPYVEAARALGVPTWRILIRHVLRNLASPILVQGTFVFAYAMLAEAGLSFLGLGVSPEVPTWGAMIADGREYAALGKAAWMILFPGSAIMLCVLALQIVGDTLRDLLDPRLRKDV